MAEEMEKKQSEISSPVQAELILPARYENRGVIGQGAMGIVIKAFDSVLGRELAIKLILNQDPLDETQKQRFLLEAKALASLDHQNIVKILSSGITDDGKLYNVMEFLSGESLAAALSAKGKLSPAEFVSIFSQVSSGLSHAYEHKIVHRDLKPGNIMLCPSSEHNVLVKIIDFGIARMEADGLSKTLTKSSVILGTPAYMSPERCTGEKADQRSDIYSLACIMYQSITGEAPFSGLSPADLMYKHLKYDAPKLEPLSRDPAWQIIARLIDRGLSKNPDQRPQTYEEIIAELERFKTESKDFDNSFKPAAKGSRKNQITYLSIFIAAAGLLSLFCILNVSRRTTPDETKSAQEQILKENDKISRAKRMVQIASKAVQRAEEQCRESRDREGLKNVLNKLQDLAQIQMNASEFAQAQATVDKELDIADKLGRQDLKVVAIKDRGEYYGRSGNRKLAFQNYDRAMQLINEFLPEQRGSLERDLLNSRVRTEILFADYRDANTDFARILFFLKTYPPVAGKDFSRGLKLVAVEKVQFRDAEDFFKGIKITKTEKERIEAVELINSIVEFLFTQDYDNKEPLEMAMGLLKKCNTDSKEFRAAAATTCRLWARYNGLIRRLRKPKSMRKRQIGI